MKRCPESEHVQDYLDGVLEPVETRRLRAHLVGCAQCAAELAHYARVFASLDRLPAFDPGPALTERVLARVLPSRVRRRWVKTLTWGYGLAASATLAAVVLWALQPRPLAALGALSAAASHRLVQVTTFVLEAASFTVVRLAQGWGLLAAAASKFAPVSRALGSVLSHRAFESTLLAAVVACALVLWWMRSREWRSGSGSPHVVVVEF